MRGLVSVVTLVALLSSTTACATPEGGSSAFGSYLAGQHARAQGDTATATRYLLDVIKADPDNVLLMQQGFALAVSDGRYDDARRLASRLVAADDQNSLAQFFLLLGDLKNRNYAAVHKDLAAIGDVGLNRLIKPLVSAWAYAGQGKKAEALAALDGLEDLPPFRPFALNHRAYLLDYLKAPEAEDAYRAIMEAENPGSLRFVLGYASWLARQGRLDDARAVIARGRERFEDASSLDLAERRLQSGKLDAPLIRSAADGVAEAFYGSALALSQDGANSPAMFYLRLALYLEPNFSQARLLLGRILEYEEQYEAALATYNAIPKGNEFSAETQLRKAWVLDALDEPETALFTLEELVASNPDNFEAVSALADLYRQRGRHQDAIMHYTRAIELAGASSNAWALYYARAIAYDLEKRWDEAEADLRKALELEPDQADVLNYLGYSWVDRGVNFEEALDFIRRAVSARPNDGYIVDSLGWVYFKLGRYEEAVEQLEKAVLLRPEDPTINDHLGDAYWSVGREAEARFQWSHVLTLDVGQTEIANLQDKIKNGLVLPQGQAVQSETPAPVVNPGP